ncbi:MAG: hypothetical protein SEPTF4163_001919 [Sporothrix epigloea]
MSAARPDLSDVIRGRKWRPRSAPPQPGPPIPPFREAPAVRPKVFTTEEGLIKDAIMKVKLSHPIRFSPGKVVAKGPTLSVGVPRPPDFVNDYTSMGPDIVASWRPGGAFRRLSGTDIRTANRTSIPTANGSSGGFKVPLKNYGLGIRYSYGHALHPWHAKYLVASPGFDEVVSDNGSGWPVGFPHSAAEVFRRRYAMKNRTEPLWWFVTVFSGDSDIPNSNLVRSKLRSKLQSAVRTALKQRGYSSAGVRLEGPTGRPARFHQLYGSMRIDGLTKPLLDTAYDALVVYLTQVVVALEAQLGGRKQGQTLPKQRRSGRPGQPEQGDLSLEDDFTTYQEGYEVIGSSARQEGGSVKTKSSFQPKLGKRPGKKYYKLQAQK